MSLEQNKAIARRWHEGWWKEGGQAILDELLTPNTTWRGGGGPNEIRELVQAFHEGASDMKLTIDDLIAEGDKVVARWTIRLKHTGNLLGYPPTGKEISYTGITIQRIENGKIIDDWYEVDGRELEKQLAGKAAE